MPNRTSPTIPHTIEAMAMTLVLSWISDVVDFPMGMATGCPFAGLGMDMVFVLSGEQMEEGRFGEPWTGIVRNNWPDGFASWNGRCEETAQAAKKLLRRVAGLVKAAKPVEFTPNHVCGAIVPSRLDR